MWTGRRPSRNRRRPPSPAWRNRRLGEHRIDCAMRRILGEQRRSQGDARTHRLRGFARKQGLTAQNTVLVGEREAYDFKPFFCEETLDVRGGFCLRLVP